MYFLFLGRPSAFLFSFIVLRLATDRSFIFELQYLRISPVV